MNDEQLTYLLKAKYFIDKSLEGYKESPKKIKVENQPKAVKMKVLDTGTERVFDSITECAKHLGVLRQTLAYNIKHNRIMTHNGVQYAFQLVTKKPFIKLP